ncbi:MAG: DUF2283 domain-containing protein [Candidatus Nanopelagicales bacterium]
MLKQTFDRAAGAMYLKVSDLAVHETVMVTDSIYVDLDADGSPVGVELLGVPSTVPFVAGPDVDMTLTTFGFPAEARLLMAAARFTSPSATVATGSRSVEAVPA